MSKTRNEGRQLALMLACAIAALFGSALVLSYAPTWLERWSTPKVPINGVATEPPRPMSDFMLTDQNDRDFKLSDLRGRPVLIFYGFTFCPDVCPVTMSDFKRIKQELGGQGDDVKFVMISVDGQRDTPEVLKRYVEAFDKSFIGLTGSEEQVANIAREYGAFFSKTKVDQSASGYTVGHTSFTYLLDKQGRWRMTYPYQAPYAGIVQDARALINER